MNAVVEIRQETAFSIDEPTRKALIANVCRAIIEHADELTALDQAIGDGDHGVNMKRGFGAVLEDLDTHAGSTLPQALKAIGLSLVMKVGGASGPLFGTFFMALGKELPEQFSVTELVRAINAAIVAVKARGKSDAGQKTMLDVLVPLHDALLAGRDPRFAANAAAEATVPLKAIRGRAAFLGDRSIGHMDPGARSVALIVGAIVDVVERRP